MIPQENFLAATLHTLETSTYLDRGIHYDPLVLQIKIIDQRSKKGQQGLPSSNQTWRNVASWEIYGHPL